MKKKRKETKRRLVLQFRCAAMRNIKGNAMRLDRAKEIWKKKNPDGKHDCGNCPALEITQKKEQRR